VTVPIIGQRYRNIRTIQRWESPRPVATEQYNRKSATFNGTDEYVDCGDILDEEGDLPFSFTGWAKVTTSTTNYVVNKHGNATTFVGYEFLVNADERLEAYLVYDFGAGNYIHVRSNTAVVPINTWAHIGMSFAGLKNASGVAFYLNGAPVTNNIVVDALTVSMTNSGKYAFAAREVDSSRYFNGSLDEFAHWSKALSAAEMSMVYRARDLRLLPFAHHLQGYWSGDGSDGSIMPDYSGNGYHGTPQNMDASNFTTDVHTPT